MKETTLMDQAKMVEIQAEEAWNSGNEEMGKLLDQKLFLIESLNELRLNSAKQKIESANFSEMVLSFAEDNAGSTMKENYNKGINFYHCCEYWEFIYYSAEELANLPEYQ